MFLKNVISFYVFKSYFDFHVVLIFAQFSCSFSLILISILNYLRGPDGPLRRDSLVPWTRWAIRTLKLKFSRTKWGKIEHAGNTQG